MSSTHTTTQTAMFSNVYETTVHTRKIMSTRWVAPCYTFFPGLKISLAAARPERVGGGGWGWGGGYFAKVSRFRSGQESQILTKTVSPPLAPRHRQQQNVRPWCYEDLLRRILSFMQSLTLTEEHNYIFLPYTFNFRSTVQNVATVFQSYNGRECLPERGIVHLNSSPECIISSPGADQNSSLLHVGKLVWDFIRFDIAEHEWEWVGLCEMRRLHRLCITGIYARIGLRLRLSRACNNISDWLIRGRWFPMM